MARKSIETGMRVIAFPGHWGFEGTVLEVAHQYPDQPSSYAKVRFDAWFKRTRWMDADYLCPIDGVIPENPHVG